MNEFPIQREVIVKNNFEGAPKETILSLMNDQSYDDISDFRDNLPEETWNELLQDSDIKKAFNDLLVELLSYGDVEGVTVVKELIKISEETWNELMETPGVQEAVKIGLIETIMTGKSERVIKNVNSILPPEYILKDPEVISAVKSRFAQRPQEDGDIDDIKQIKSVFLIGN